MLTRRPEPGGHQQRAQLVTVQADRVRLIVQPRPAHMCSGRVVKQVFSDRVPAEPGYGAHAASDGGAGPAASLQVAGEAFDAGPAGLEQAKLVLLAPGGVLSQVRSYAWRVSPL